jgi:hypothetical protein
MTSKFFVEEGDLVLHHIRAVGHSPFGLAEGVEEEEVK